jgi:thiamine kinase-like enzyme
MPLSHNDVHAGNIFLKNGDGAVLDRLTLVDFDNAAFGPRAWDLLYYFFNWQRNRSSHYCLTDLHCLESTLDKCASIFLLYYASRHILYRVDNIKQGIVNTD